MHLTIDGFADALEQKGLRLGFGGRVFSSWSCIQLRQLVRIFDTSATFRRGHTKIDLCEQLLRIKPGPVAEDEQEQVNAVCGFDISDWHRSELDTFYQKRAEQRKSKEASLATKRPAPDRGSSERPVKRERLDREDVDGLARMVLKRIRKRQCEVCLADLPGVDFKIVPEDANCQHEAVTTCSKCFAEHIKSQVDSSTLYDIKRPEPGCTASLTASQMHQYAPATLLTRYTDALFSQYLEQNPEYLRCCNSACNSGQIVDMAYTSTYMSCPDCKTQTCITCDTEWHPNMSHDDNLANIKQAEADRLAKLKQAEREEREKRQREKDQEDAAALELMERDSALCAKCGLWMIKISGCDHMTCKCGHQLCYVCRADYKPIALRGNHHHKPDCRHPRAIPRSSDQRRIQPDVRMRMANWFR